MATKKPAKKTKGHKKGLKKAKKLEANKPLTTARRDSFSFGAAGPAGA